MQYRNVLIFQQIVYHAQQPKVNFFGFQSEESSVSASGSREEKAAARIQAAYRGYKERKLMKEREPKKYRRLVEKTKKIKKMFKNSARARALRMFTPSKNKLAQKTM